MGFCFCSWRLKVFVLVLRMVESFFFVLGDWRFLSLLLERLKVFTLAFECWMFLFFSNVEGAYFYFLMWKVIVLILGCSKFLLLVLDVESFCYYSWILKVPTFVLGCWRFLLLLLHVEGFCFWMLKVLIFILGCWRFFIFGLLFICIY
jgi:hypothetical protein